MVYFRTPQTVVLEGKYWKRHAAVIKAEYRKWRKNYKSKAIGCLTYDSVSIYIYIYSIYSIMFMLCATIW